MHLQDPIHRRPQLDFAATGAFPIETLAARDQIEDLFVSNDFQQWTARDRLASEVENPAGSMIHQHDTAALVDGNDPLDHAIKDGRHLSALALQVPDFLTETLGHEVERPP